MTRRTVLNFALGILAVNPEKSGLIHSESTLSEPLDEDATYMIVLQPKGDLPGKVLRDLQEGANHFFESRFPTVKIVPVVLPNDCDVELYKVPK